MLKFGSAALVLLAVAANAASFYDIKAKDVDNNVRVHSTAARRCFYLYTHVNIMVDDASQVLDFAELRGRTALIVNVASE